MTRVVILFSSPAGHVLALVQAPLHVAGEARTVTV